MQSDCFKTSPRRSSSEKPSELPSKKLFIESDCLFPEAEEDCCYVCKKDLRRLDELRKALHINNCLDQQEAKSKYESNKQNWSNTVDCPICGTPLQPGPFRAAHAKSCGRKHQVPGERLLALMDTQAKVADVRKKNGLSHTKMNEPKIVMNKPRVNKEEPRTAFDEQMKLAMAISASLDSTGENISVPQPKQPQALRSRKLRPRSYSFVELEPRSCKCSVFEELQENFLQRFKVKRPGDFKEVMRRRRMRSSLLLGDIKKCLHKLERLERLADDLSRYASLGGDVTIFSLENEAISIHRFIIAARVPLLLPLIGSDGVLPLRDYSAAALRCYVRFLYSSTIEWTENERPEVLTLANQYGPNGLAALCRSPVESTSQEEPISKNLQHNLEMDRIASFEKNVSEQKPSSTDSPIMNSVKESTASSALFAVQSSKEVEGNGSGSRSGSCCSENAFEDESMNNSFQNSFVKRRGGRIPDVNAGKISTATEIRNVVCTGEDNEEANKKQRNGEDPDGSVVFIGELPATGKTIKRFDESEGLEIDSGNWLEGLLPSSDGVQQQRVSEIRNTGHSLLENRILNPAKSRILPTIMSPNSSPDVFDISSDDDERNNLEDANLMSKGEGCSDNRKDQTQILTKDSLEEDRCLELKLRLSEASMEKLKSNYSAAEMKHKSPSSVSETSSLNYTLGYSPLPLPFDSFYDSMGNDRDTGREDFNNLLVGSDGGRKHKSAGCIPCTSDTPKLFSFASDEDEFKDSFFESPLAQPAVSRTPLRSCSSHLSDILCSPIPKKRPPKTFASSLKDSRKHSPAIRDDDTGRLDVIGDCSPSRKLPFGVPLSPIGKSEAEPSSSHIFTEVAPTNGGVRTNVQYCSTPNPDSTRLARRLKELGSNVKVLKTTNITPLPDFALMSDKQLKNELAKYGVRPMGRKRAIALLKRIYDELHPVVDGVSPVSSKPKGRLAVAKLSDRINNELDDGEDLRDKTLNRSLNEEDILEESCINVYDEDAPLPKDLDGMQIALLAWLRREDNADLYNTLLGLNPVSFEEFCARLSRADTAVAKIPKKALMEILDRLHITFSLPADGWKKRREKKQNLRMRK
uniref:BTB domain-containing protein n=1 Tax=Ascaris lumbricoides TaxID=6252 RepID=A0A9J2PN90_ASCLU